ncbi:MULTISPECIES: amidase [unclassified Mesorhizobium]|uniref:amidase n=1 Tax=unclassified Mesorhizobium TaxID=325217 RepID=UPI00333C4B9E
MVSSSSNETDIPELCQFDAETLARLYGSGDLSPVEVTNACLRHSSEVQERLNCFTFVDADRALAAAKASEARWQAGEPQSPIDGVPTTLKDIVHVENWSVRYGSAATEATPFTKDAPAVAGLRKAGAVFISQTTMPEFGWKAVTDSPVFGATRNPWNANLTPGGSSGGAAVAAATGVGALHLGTDGGGSIRIPSSFTGIVGHKPSFGRVAAYPPSAFGTVAHIGPMTRSVRDCINMLDAMTGRDLRDWTQPYFEFSQLKSDPVSWAGRRVGYWKSPVAGNISAEVGGTIDDVIQDLIAEGAEVREITLPFDDDLLEVFYRHWYLGAANRLSGFSETTLESMDSGLVKAAEAGRRYSGVDRIWAELRRAQFGAEMDRLLSSLDVILSPTVAVLPFEAGRETPPGSDFDSWIEWASFSFPINLSQQPACSIPVGFSSDHLPIGIQVIGARGDDTRVLRAGLALEEMYQSLFLKPGARWPV